MIEGLRGLRVPVSNLQQARAWYAALLDAEPFGDEHGTCLFTVAGGTLELVGAEPSHAAIAMGAGDFVVASGKPASQPAAFWGVDHLGSELARLADAGLRPIEPPRMTGPGVQMAFFSDPSGNVVGLVERDDPGVRRARSQRVAEKVALRNVRSKVDELVEEQRALERFESLVTRIGVVVVLALLVLGFAWYVARH